jgi:hypothetical protein
MWESKPLNSKYRIIFKFKIKGVNLINGWKVKIEENWDDPFSLLHSYGGTLKMVIHITFLDRHVCTYSSSNYTHYPILQSSTLSKY